MDLIETLRNITVREGFEAGRSVRELSEETGLTILEVLRREMDMHLIPEGRDIVRAVPTDLRLRRDIDAESNWPLSFITRE